MSNYRFQCCEAPPQVAHCPVQIVPSPPPQISPMQCTPCNCGFTKSKLFCSSENGVVAIEALPSADFWQNVTTLEICQENCSEVLHEVTGLASAPIANSNSTPLLETLVFNLTFRIIDEFGKEVCKHSFNYAQDITIPPNTSFTVDFPFHLKCCDKPLQCECNTTYRLQVSSTTSNLIVFLRDITWAAIVWEKG